MIIDYTSSSPETTVQALIGRGYDGGSWNGDGITSSSAAAHAGDSHKTALGYGETDSGELNISTFAGHSVDSTTVVIRYTWFGDGNIDGYVDLTDYTYLVAHYNTLSGAVWLYGDYDYDGDVDLTDMTYFNSNFNQNGFPS
jgi:hypothetical protein